MARAVRRVSNRGLGWQIIITSVKRYTRYSRRMDQLDEKIDDRARPALSALPPEPPKPPLSLPLKLLVFATAFMSMATSSLRERDGTSKSSRAGKPVT